MTIREEVFGFVIALGKILKINIVLESLLKFSKIKVINLSSFNYTVLLYQKRFSNKVLLLFLLILLMFKYTL